MLVPFVAFCYVPILLNASCHNGLQIVILDPGWSLERDVLSRNILGQDAHSRVLRPCSQLSLSALVQLPQLGSTCFARLQQRHV